MGYTYGIDRRSNRFHPPHRQTHAAGARNPGASGVDELRRFRHVFRNLYQSELDPERLALIQDRLPALLGRFRGAHAAFIENIDRLLEAMRPLDR